MRQWRSVVDDCAARNLRNEVDVSSKGLAGVRLAVAGGVGGGEGDAAAVVFREDLRRRFR